MPKVIVPVYDHWKSLTQIEFNKLMLDFEAFCEEGSIIIDKNSQAVPMKLNEAQLAVANMIIEEVFAEIPQPINLFIHKCRQMGITSVLIKIEQFLCSRKKDLNTQHVMPTEEDAEDLAEKKFLPQLQATHPELLPEIHQTKRRMRFTEFGGVMLRSSVTFQSSQKQAPGHGQPIKDSTPVPTPNGFKNHGDLVPGDIVFDKYGKETTVENVYPQGIIDLYRVKLSDGSWVDAGLTHRWEVYKSSRPAVSILTTKDIIDRLNNGKRVQFDRASPVEYTEKNLVLDPYKLGLLLGDGHIDPLGRTYIYSMDMEILDQFDGDIKTQPNNQSYRKYCRGITPIIKQLDLCGKNSWDKFIPKQYLQGSIEQRKKLLAGLLDTDGGICNGQIEYSTVSLDLMSDVSELVRSLGGRCTIGVKFRKRNIYRLGISMPFNPFGIKRKIERWYPPRNIKRVSVISVDPIEQSSAQCIAVKSPSHTYLVTKSCIVTHNTNQVVIEDEQAHYEKVARLEKGMIATMPKVGLSLRVVVSTAKGMNHFYDLSKVAQKSQHWKYLFLPWHMLAEYEMEPKGRLQSLDMLTEYEVKLCDIFETCGYPVETWARKMYWYEYTFETEAKRDWDHMFENYPSIPEESFAATGTPVLPSAKLYQLKEAERPFKYIELMQDNFGKVDFREVHRSSIKQFTRPVPGRKYVIGADPADGGADGDNSAAVIIDLTTMENVLSIKEKIDQNEFAELLNHLGRYYNMASIVPERNTGQTLIDWLVMLRYPNIHIDPLHTTTKKVQYGVYMTRPLKNEAIARAKFFLNQDIYKDYDPDFIDEGLHFSWTKTPSGLQKAEGTEGYGDDVVMSRLILFASLNMSKYKDYAKQQAQQSQT